MRNDRVLLSQSRKEGGVRGASRMRKMLAGVMTDDTAPAQETGGIDGEKGVGPETAVIVTATGEIEKGEG